MSLSPMRTSILANCQIESRQIVLTLAATILVLISATAMGQSAPPPSQVSIEQIAYIGPGCPIGSAASNLSPDRKAFTILFDQLSVTTGATGPGHATALCSLDVRLRVPAGWTYSLYKSDVRGFADISAGSIGIGRSTYTFGAQQALVVADELRGPYSENYQHSHTVDAPALVWAPCAGSDAERSLGVRVGLELKGRNSLMTVDSIDGSLSHVYGLSWKRCSGAGAPIGPRPIVPSGPTVRLISAAAGSDVAVIQPYPGSFRGGAFVAMADINGDNFADVITGAGPGGGPHVRAFDGRNGAPLGGPLGSFFAFDSGFTGGVAVAGGDVDGDGRDDVVVAAASMGGPHVRALSGATGAELASFFAYDAGFRGGVRIAVGDVNGDGRADIITGVGPGGGPHVKVFDVRSGAVLRSFFAYDASFRGGVSVAAGDLNRDGIVDIITGALASGGPHVKAFDGRSGAETRSLFAYDSRFRGGVSVAAGDLNGDGHLDIVTGAGPGGGPHVRVISGADGLALPTWIGSFFAYTPTFRGGLQVASSARRRPYANGPIIVIAPAGS